jgi:hypothetical protein
MNDDWRLRIELDSSAQAGELTVELKSHALDDDSGRSIHDRVVVSVDGPEVFCYAGTREQADSTQKAIEQLATSHNWTPRFELRHWHPTAERWEDPDVPLPHTDAELAAEVQRRIAQERADSEAQGYPEFEVRVQCHSRGEAGELADRLRNEGIPVVHRWSAVLVGALDEESANRLADRLRAEAPEGSTVTAEGNLRAIYNERPWRPFSVLGGLGG